MVAVSGLDPESAMPQKRKPGKGGRADPEVREAIVLGRASRRSRWTGRPGGPGGPGGFTPPKDLTPEEVGLIRAWIDQGAK